MINFLILICCISLDSFVVMMEKGATALNITVKKAIIHSAIFAGISSLMFFVGYLLGDIFNLEELYRLNVLVTSLIFFGIAFLIFVKTTHRKEFIEKLDLSFSYNTSAKLALLVSIDTFLIGITTTASSVELFESIIITFLITFAVILIALSVGYYRGANHQKKLCYICSLIYLILGIVEISELFTLI